MEVFSLLKFWRNAAGGGGTSSLADTLSDVDFSVSSSHEVRKHVDEDSDLDDSFFDLVFSSPESDPKKEKYSTTSTVGINDDDDDGSSVKSKLDGRESSSKFMESPTDVFFKTKLLQSESKSSTKPQSPISLLKSSPKLRVFMLGFSKPKLVKKQVSCASMDSNAPSQKCSSNRFIVDCKIEEVPIASLLTRDNSLRAKLRTEKFEVTADSEPSKPFSKDRIQKYLNLMKPLYVKASKRYNEKTRFPEQSPGVTPSSSPATAPVFSPREEKQQGSRGAVFREVRKHLGKSRSESRSMAGKVVPSTVRRRDDSLLQDGIQSAILHCKLSYNNSSSQGCSVLSRSGSAPAHGKSTEQNSIEEEKRSSI